MKKRVFILAIFLIIFFSIFIILFDYFNLTTTLGLDINKININIISILINNVLVLVLFITTYHFIDSRHIDAEKQEMQININKRTAGLCFIKKTSESCKIMIDTLTPEVVTKYVVTKVDFNKPGNIGISKELKDSPFTFDIQINALFSDGILKMNEWLMYQDLKSTYSNYIDVLITFFDDQKITDRYLEKINNSIRYVHTYLSNIDQKENNNSI